MSIDTGRASTAGDGCSTQWSTLADAFFPAGLVVEVAGHGTHSSRRQVQRDEQRRTELTLRGFRVITFTYNDIRDRLGWVLIQLRAALALAAS